MFNKTRVELSVTSMGLFSLSLFSLLALSNCNRRELRSDWTASSTACLDTKVSVSERSLKIQQTNKKMLSLKNAFFFKSSNYSYNSCYKIFK